jgi:hypothetical protein
VKSLIILALIAVIGGLASSHIEVTVTIKPFSKKPTPAATTSTEAAPTEVPHGNP